MHAKHSTSILEAVAPSVHLRSSRRRNMVAGCRRGGNINARYVNLKTISGRCLMTELENELRLL